MAEDLSKNRLTGPENRGTQGSRTAAAKKPAASPAAQTNKVVGDFLNRVKADEGKDTGKRPGFLQRAAVVNQQPLLKTLTAVLLAGKDYELARRMFEHYLTADGDPLIYTPPQSVQDAIRRKFRRPGHFRNVSGYGNWATPDIRNGLGHFDLDVVKSEKGLTYFITDRYEFPDKVDGRVVRHGFQVGKLPQKTVDFLNDKLSKLGEYKRDSGSATEKFELQKDLTTGEHTIFAPQKVLADNGTDFDSMGVFSSEVPSH